MDYAKLYHATGYGGRVECQDRCNLEERAETNSREGASSRRGFAEKRRHRCWKVLQRFKRYAGIQGRSDPVERRGGLFGSWRTLAGSDGVRQERTWRDGRR